MPMSADQRLARHAKALQERNLSMLQVSSGQSSKEASSSAAANKATSPGGAANAVGGGGGGGSSEQEWVTLVQTSNLDVAHPYWHNNTLMCWSASSLAVKQAYFSSVEAQLKAARDELSTLYKTQSQNAQKLVSLNEQMREKDDRERDTSEDTRRLNEEMIRVKRKEGDLRSVVDEKDKMIQVRDETIESTASGH
jgi:hypothetical protein